MMASPRSVLMVFSRQHDVQEPTGGKQLLGGTSAGQSLPPVALRLKKKWGGGKELGMEEKVGRARAMRASHLAKRQAAAGSVSEKVLRALSTRKMRVSSTAFSHVEKMTSAESHRERSRLATIAQGAKFGTQAIARARKARQLALLKKREGGEQRQQNALFARHKHLEERGQRLRLRRAENRQRFLERIRSKHARLQQQLERATERRAAALANRTRHAHVSAKRAQEALSRLQSRAEALAARANRAQNRASLKRSTAVAARRLAGAAKRAAFRGRWMKRVGDLTARIARVAQVHCARREERIAERREKGRAMGTVRVAEAVARNCTRAILSQALSAHAQSLAASRRLSLTASRVSTARRLGPVRCQHVADRDSAAKKAAFERFVGKLVDASARRLAHKRMVCARAAAMGSGAVIQGRERLAVKLQKMWVLLESRLEAATERRDATIARLKARAQIPRAHSERAHARRARAQTAAAFRLETKLENARARRSEALARAAAGATRNERRRAWARGFGELKSAAMRRGLEKRSRRAGERRTAILASKPGKAARSGRRSEGSVEGRVAELDQRLMWAAMKGVVSCSLHAYFTPSFPSNATAILFINCQNKIVLRLSTVVPVLRCADGCPLQTVFSCPGIWDRFVVHHYLSSDFKAYCQIRNQRRFTRKRISLLPTFSLFDNSQGSSVDQKASELLQVTCQSTLRSASAYQIFEFVKNVPLDTSSLFRSRARHVARVKEAARRTARPRVSAKPVMQTQHSTLWEAKRERAQTLRDARAQKARSIIEKVHEKRTRVSQARAEVAAELANKIEADMKAAVTKREAFLRARRLSADRKDAAAAAAAQQLQAWRAAGKARASQENAAKRRHVSLEATRSKAGKSVARHLDVVNQQRVKLAEVKNGILERQEKRVSEGGKRREELLVARRARAQESAAFSLRAVRRIRWGM